MDRKPSARDSKRQELREDFPVIPVFYCPLFFPSFPLLVLCDTMSVRYCLF